MREFASLPASRLRPDGARLVGLFVVATALGCTPSKQQDARVAPKAAEVEAGAQAEPVQADGAEATGGSTGDGHAERAAVPDHAPVDGWSCVCFKEKGNEGPQLATACRRSATACGALQRRVEGGSRTLIRNSVPDGKGCRAIGEAKHPDVILGESGTWQPSKKPGAFSYVGKCLLDADEHTTSELEYALGPLSLGMSSAAVLEALGAPEKKGEIWEEAATGEWVQTWGYDTKGLSLGMAAGTEKGAQGLSTISASAPCALETPRGVAVGDPFSEVQANYARFSAPKWEHGDDFFVAGSIYGGVIFHEVESEHGEQIVETIFIGAAAE